MKIIEFEVLPIKKQRERWEQAKRVLENLPAHDRKKHWNMGEWGIETECGTIACAAGHCGMDPWFIRRGLDLKNYELVEEEGLKVYDFNFGDAVSLFFGREGAEAIFFNPNPRSVDKVIKEIDKYLKILEDENKINLLRDEINKINKEANAKIDKIRNEQQQLEFKVERAYKNL